MSGAALVEMKRRPGRFLERLGLYLLVGPAVATATLILLASLFASMDGRAPSVDLDMWLLMLGMMYLAGVPVVFVYACLIEIVLRTSGRVTFGTFLFCVFLISLVVFPPLLVFAGDSDDPVRHDFLSRVYAAAFMPVFLAGLICWRMAPALHRALDKAAAS